MMSVITYFFYALLMISIFRLAFRVFLSLSYNLKRRTKEGGHYPRISIIVPAYNEEATIKECIKSLLALEYPNYEVIVVDDGSTDKTLEEARKFSSKNLKVIHQSNQGKSNALNNGIRSSSF